MMKKYTPWWVCLVGGLFFFYHFIQMTFLNPMADVLMQVFDMDSTAFGYLASMYFFGIASMVLVAGLLADKFTPRVLMVTLTGCTVVSLLLMTQVHSVTGLLALRFAQGMIHGFTLLTCVKLASRWFAPKQMGLITSLIVTLGLLGGFVAQNLFSWQVSVEHWQQAFYLNALIGVGVMLLMLIFVRDNPQAPVLAQHASLREHGAHIWQALRHKQNFLSGLYVCFTNLPIIILGTAWGDLYLEGVWQLGTVQTGFIISMMFVGFMIGSPVFGWLSDTFQKQKIFLSHALWPAIAVLLLLISAHTHLTPYLPLLFFLLGFFISPQVLIYAMATSHNPLVLTASAMAVITLVIMLGNALVQVLFGYMLDADLSRLLVADGTGAFNLGLGLIVLGLFAAFACLKGLRDIDG